MKVYIFVSIIYGHYKTKLKPLKIICFSFVIILQKSGYYTTAITTIEKNLQQVKNSLDKDLGLFTTIKSSKLRSKVH